VNGEENSMSAYRKLLDRYVECYNAGDLDGVMDLYADDAVQGMPDGIFEGRAAIRERLANELEAIPDVTHTVVSFIEQGDAFADEWTFVGTQTGPLTLPDGTVLAPTGKRVEVQGMEVVRVGPDGKIVLNTLYFDNLAVAIQLGVAPEGASAGVGSS
jgi:predicted ester cyclase